MKRKDIRLEEALRLNFKYTSFRPGQKEIIEDVLKGNDVLGILPTGSGKSVCYQLPAMLQDGVTIVVSPLISLMIDQVKQLKAVSNIPVVALNSFMDYGERKEVYRHLDEYKLIYVSPELLQQGELISILKRLPIHLFVIDEAHCISQWGHDFRPDYLKLKHIINQMNHPTVLALSATATPEVQNDIIASLDRPRIMKHIYPMDRNNIAFCIERTENDQEKTERIAGLLQEYPVPTLIYFSSRQTAENTAAILASGLSSKRIAFYHGGMEQMDRIMIQQQFMNGQLDVICCTSAFGMGINKNNIRLVIHYHFPLQLESFIQEVGRAGRDGKPSVSLLFYAEKDVHLPLNLLKNEQITEAELKTTFQILFSLYRQGSRLPEHESEKINLLQLDEIKLRFFIYHAEKHGMISNNVIYYQKEVWLNAYRLIKKEIEERNSYKERKLTEMLSWIHEAGCLREHLYKHFQSSFSEPVSQCCSNCGFSFANWKPETSETVPEKPMNWKDQLKKLLLIGEDNETK